jgi:hypothetical protein
MELADFVGMSGDDKSGAEDESDQDDPKKLAPPVGGRLRFGVCVDSSDSECF